MSQTTATALKTAPPAADAVTLTSGSGTWANGSWVQVLAATGAAAAVAGIVFDGTAGNHFEVDVGVGASGSEVVLTTFRLRWAGAAFGGPFVAWLPSPVTGIASGARIALRARADGTSISGTAALLYYESLDGTNSSSLPTVGLPSAANAVSVTPSGTAWANSAYTQVTSGLGAAASILSIAFTESVANVEGEWDIAIGAAGSEVVITTLRFASAANANAGPIDNILLPAPYPISASTRVAVRLRKSGTSTTAYTVALLNDASVGAPPITGTGDVTFAAPALAGSGTVEATGTGDVTFGGPALAGDGPGLVVAITTRATQLAAEVLDVIPPSPVSATQVAAEILFANANEARVTQVVCELIVVAVSSAGCAAAFPIEDVATGAACRVQFPVT